MTVKMKESVKELFGLTLGRNSELIKCADKIEEAFYALTDCFHAGGKVLLCGNGGSAADCEHIVGELMKGFLRKRPLPQNLQERLITADSNAGSIMAVKLQTPLPAISLNSHPALSAAIINDIDASVVYAQQLLGLGSRGDVLIGISTSGNAVNVYNAAVAAKALDIKVIALTGEKGGKLAGIADILISVPANETYQIQELHLPVYHALCGMVEKEFFDL